MNSDVLRPVVYCLNGRQYRKNPVKYSGDCSGPVSSEGLVFQVLCMCYVRLSTVCVAECLYVLREATVPTAWVANFPDVLNRLSLLWANFSSNNNHWVIERPLHLGTPDVHEWPPRPSWELVAWQSWQSQRGLSKVSSAHVHLLLRFCSCMVCSEWWPLRWTITRDCSVRLGERGTTDVATLLQIMKASTVLHLLCRIMMSPVTLYFGESAQWFIQAVLLLL